MKVYIPMMSATDETHKITSYLDPTAYKRYVDAKAVIKELAEAYDQTEGYIRIDSDAMSILYKVKSNPSDYTIELRIEVFEVS